MNIHKNNKNIHYKWNVFRVLDLILTYGIFGVLLFIYLHSYMLVMCLAIFALLPFISVFFLTQMIKHVNVTLFSSDDEVHLNDELSIGIVVTNSSLFTSLHCACNLEFANSFMDVNGKQTISVPVTAKSTFKSPLICNVTSLGVFSVKLENYILSDMFGILKVVCDSNDSFDIVVLPNADEPDDNVAMGLMEGMSDNEDDTRKGNEYADISNIREYIPGDRIKDIHWKLSAKKDKLLVKERIHTSERQMIIWLDSSDSKRIVTDILSEAYSVLCHVIREGILVKLMWYDYSSNSVNEYSVLDNYDLINAFIKIYSSKRGMCHEDIRGLVPLSSNIISLIRIGYKDDDVRIYTYEI